MKIFYSQALPLLVAAGSLLFSSCNNAPGGAKLKDDPKGSIQPANSVKDTLPDTPEFVVEFDNKEYTIDPAKVSASTGSDSVILLFARTGDTSGIHLAIPIKKELPFSVPSGYSSKNTKIAFSEEQAVLPTVVLSNYPNVDVSFNNLDDGYHKQDLQPDAITITGYRFLEGDELHGKTWLVKGFIHTTVLKSVYNGSDKPYNHDYTVKGHFVFHVKTY